MADLATTIKNEAQRLACAVLSDAQARANYLSRAVSGIPGSGVGTGIATFPINLLTNFACGNQPPESRDGDRLNGNPYQPGQCPFQYQVEVTYTGYAAKGFSTGIGPVLGLLQTENNTFVTFAGSGNKINAFRGQDIEARITNIERTGSQPDECGNPDDPRPEFDGPVTYDGPDGPVTVNVNIKLDDPVQDPGGGLTIPFFWVDPDININPDLNLDIEPEVDFFPRRKCTPDIDLPDIEIDPENDDPPPEEDGSVLAGVIVTTTVLTTEKTTGRFEDGANPTIYIPRCATVVFAVNVGGVRCWTKPVDVMTLRAWVPAKGEIYPYAAVAKPALGFSCEVENVFIKGTAPAVA
jgi:hypothetical protein